MAHTKQIIGWTAIVLFVATLAGIWVLTEQNAVQTSLLSESTARVERARLRVFKLPASQVKLGRGTAWLRAPIRLPRLSSLVDLLPFACG